MNESIRALVGQLSYDVEDGTGAMVMVSRDEIRAIIKALKPTIENYDIVDGKFVLCPTCGALPCDWGNDLNYRAAINEVKP